MKELNLENKTGLKSNDDVLVSAKNISKKYSLNLKSSLKNGIKDIFYELFSRKKKDLRKDEFWALHNVSFELKRGESLAIIGANGAGKSTLLKILYGLIKPDLGEVHLRGNLDAIIEVNSGLNYVLSGRENIYIKASLLGLTKKQTNNVVEKIVEFAEIGDFIDSPVQFYSTGMISRLSFAISTQLNPEILIIDEALAVGDYNFQRKCIDYLSKYISKGGSLILVSHNPSQIQTICQKGIILEKGEMKFEGNIVDAIDRYLIEQNSIVNGENTDLREPQTVTEQDPLVIEKVTIESVTGGEIKTGDDVKLTVYYCSYREINDTYWAFNIYSMDDLICIAGNSALIPATFNKGKSSVSCVIPNFNLVAGTYLLKIALGYTFESSSFPFALLGWQDSPYIFSVKSQPNLLTNGQLAHRQLTVMEVKLP